MRKDIITLLFMAIIIILIISTIFINYKSDVEAINNLNINLNDIDIENFDPKKPYFKLNLDLEIINPSDRGINDLSTDFNIFIEDNLIGKGNFSNVNIKKDSNISKEVIITIYYNGLADAVVKIIKNILNSEDFILKIDGTMYSKTLFGFSIIEQTYIATKTYP